MSSIFGGAGYLYCGTKGAVVGGVGGVIAGSTINNLIKDNK